MSILLNEGTRALVQGITGRVGRVQTEWMLEYGTKIVAGVTPGKGGEEVHGVPVYETVVEAVSREGANASVIFVPAPFAKDAALEALEAELTLVVIITEHIPIHDAMAIKRKAASSEAWVIGPNCPGLLTPGVGKLGIMPANLFQTGDVGIAGRSATLTYEIAGNLTLAGFGQTTAVGIGGDPVVGTSFRQILELFEADEATSAVVLVGEIGGSAEEEAAPFIARMNKPVVALVAGRGVPPGKTFGHAGAIIREREGSAEYKIRCLAEAGARIAQSPCQVPMLLREIMQERI